MNEQTPPQQSINQFVERFASKVQADLRASAASFTKGKRAGFVLRGNAAKELSLLKSIKSKVYKRHGEAERVSVSIARHGVFVHYGVGRGYQRQGGMVVRVGKTPPTGPARKPADWFNPFIEKHVRRLADQISESKADAAVNAAVFNLKK